MPNKNRTLIKLDDEVIEITRNAKGLIAKKLSDQDLLEVSLLDEGVEKLIENDINKVANEAYKELQNSFKQTLKANVLKVVGFSGDRWNNNGWEVDHCNGRSSALTEYMSSKVQQQMVKEFDSLLGPELEALLKTTKKGLVKEFQQCFNRTVKEQIYSKATKAAEDFLTDVMKKSMKKFQRQAVEKAEVAFLGRKARVADEDVDEVGLDD